MVASILPPKTTLKLHKHRSPVSLSTTPLKGDNADDYTTPVYLNGQGPFALNVDTGSALLGVAGNESIGCDLYYDASSCDGGPIKVVYGSGFWSGVVCEATVTLGEYEIKNYKFGAYQEPQRTTKNHKKTPRTPMNCREPPRTLKNHQKQPKTTGHDHLRAHAGRRRLVTSAYGAADELHAGSVHPRLFYSAGLSELHPTSGRRSSSSGAESKLATDPLRLFRARGWCERTFSFLHRHRRPERGAARKHKGLGEGLGAPPRSAVRDARGRGPRVRPPVLRI